MTRSGPIDVNSALLALYECALDPDQFPAFLVTMEAWLQNHASPDAVTRIETASDPIWKKLTVSHMAQLEQARAADTVFVLRDYGYATQASAQTDWDCFADTIHADDLTRLRNWMGTARDGATTLVRAAGGQGAGTVYLITRTDGLYHVTDTHSELSNTVEAILINSFGISHSEMAVLRQLVLGQTVQDISTELGKSPETIRSQVKSLAQKLSVKRQQDIQRLVGNIEKHTRDDGINTATNQEGTRAQITRDGGRVLTYACYGPKSGAAVVLCPDFSGGSHLPKGTAKACADHGLRVIVLTRAGYGRSGAVTSEGAALIDSHRADHLAVLTHEGITEFATLGMGTGMALAYDLALAYPDQVTHVTGLNIYPPVTSHQDAMHFKSGMYRVGALASFYTPKMLRVLTNFVVAQAVRIRDARQFFAMSAEDDPQDETYFTEFLKPNLDDILAGKGKGSAADCSYLAVNWAQLGRNDVIRPQTQILQHADFPFVSADLTRAFAASIGATFTRVNRPFRQSHHDVASLAAYLAARLK